ncbi:uncharacterized protein MONOS_4549 [Monocercomonoides exilis]|uniref:uncharacterized protein n=1 Tax=Monocercomonoides exilis TaxID=2049356 RepID=UPI00355A0D09|nr:hypothetical protein MONOS_4549 [Monocercomonoides exilis]|eukprot:MONOS_4549.1-p1 / transcript=MONOS_4549.1 / gene=MONOS_4549 / organism=Monocercomonoides_exilis_PA203 / gene_product=unspecified product / transcript_product=unspecified product / location=Mono_scaffold00122:45940-47022(+) / protein_length=331 / sequence_SO=supercontig / SO=protein_coding / is_pseudo=false
MLLVARAAQKSSLRSAHSSSSSSSTGAARRSTSPFRRRRSNEKKAAEDDKPSQPPSIDPADASVTASNTSSGAMSDIERRLRIAVSEAAGVYEYHKKLLLRAMKGYVVALQAVLYGGVVCSDDVAFSAMLSVPLVALFTSLAAQANIAITTVEACGGEAGRGSDEVIGRGIAVCEVGEIVEKGLSAAGLRTEDVVLLPEEIALDVLEEREEAEEGERGGKEGEERGEEYGGRVGGKDEGREGGDGNEEKGGYPAAHREFVERIKENLGKMEKAMEQLVVEALGLSWLRFVKAEADCSMRWNQKCAVLLHLMEFYRRTGEQKKRSRFIIWE